MDLLEDDDVQESLRGMALNLVDDHPAICILCVADVDLTSAAALAEFALTENLGRVDLCIACGPFLHPGNFNKYLQGRYNGNKSSNDSSTTSREETAAMEGIMTGAISQLESIVCRVVYLPSSSEPNTLTACNSDIRLTANSRNVRERWLQLAPGLGCTGLYTNEEKEDSNHIRTITTLLDLAHPTCPPQPYSYPPQYPKPVQFDSPTSHAILLSHHTQEQCPNHYSNMDDNYLEMMDSPRIQRQVLLNVLGGGKEPFEGRQGNVHFVTPGSLRENGDFCLVHLALCEQKGGEKDSKSSMATPPIPALQRLHSWRVNRVEFRNMTSRAFQKS